jgi:hypothetical protein
MSERKNDGGFAFPGETTTLAHDDGPLITVKHGGMKLRDYFAGQALAGMSANEAWVAYAKGCVRNGAHGTPEEWTAKQAYELADSMLAERSKA